MMVCSEIRSLEQERVAVDRVRILEQELLEEEHGGKGIMVSLYVRLGGGRFARNGRGVGGLGR